MNSNMEKDKEGAACEYQENLNYLRQVDFFSGLPLEAIKVFAYLCTREFYKAGDYMFQKDEEGDQAFYLISGSASLLTEIHGGKQEIRAYGEGDFIGRLVLMGAVRHLFSLRAKTDVVCVTITGEKFSKALAQFPTVIPKMVKVIVENIYNWEKRFLSHRKPECIDCFKEMGVSLV